MSETNDTRRQTKERTMSDEDLIAKYSTEYNFPESFLREMIVIFDGAESKIFNTRKSSTLNLMFNEIKQSNVEFFKEGGFFDFQKLAVFAIDMIKAQTQKKRGESSQTIYSWCNWVLDTLIVYHYEDSFPFLCELSSEKTTDSSDVSENQTQHSETTTENQTKVLPEGINNDSADNVSEEKSINIEETGSGEDTDDSNVDSTETGTEEDFEKKFREKEEEFDSLQKLYADLVSKQKEVEIKEVEKIKYVPETTPYIPKELEEATFLDFKLKKEKLLNSETYKEQKAGDDLVKTMKELNFKPEEIRYISDKRDKGYSYQMLLECIDKKNHTVERMDIFLNYLAAKAHQNAKNIKSEE